MRFTRAKTPTQTDVATLAGVSTATVSRVLNGSDLVTAEARSRVEQAMRDLNYVPHEAARSLASSRTRIVGAIIPTLNNAIFAEGINAFEAAARAQGYTLLLSISNYDLADEEVLTRKMIERGVEGLLLIGNEHNPETFGLLNAKAVHHVCGWAFSEDRSAVNIGFSNRAAMAEMVDHLVQLGHRKFALLAGITKGNDRARERCEGGLTRLRDHGLKVEDGFLKEIPYSIREGRAAFRAIMTAPSASGRPTAIMCGNDVIAVGALLEAQAMGLRVPEDLAITGYDNLRLSEEIPPGITTIDVPAERMGRDCATALIQAIETGMPVTPLQLQTRLIKRGSTVGQEQQS